MTSNMMSKQLFSKKPAVAAPVFKAGPKVAIVHDYLREYGGAERVIEALHELFPGAPVYVGFIDRKALGSAAARFADWDIRSTYLQKIPFITKLYSPLRFLAPRAFVSLKLHQYDVVISSTNAYFSKAVRASNGVHFCYCHTPARSLYGYDTQGSLNASRFMKLASNFLNHFLRLTDFELAQKVDVFLANSQEVSARIRKFYRRGSEVLYPPVKFVDQLEKNWPSLSSKRRAAFQKSAAVGKKGYYLYVNRLNYAKHPELAVTAALQNNLNLKVVGSGPLMEQLTELAQGHANQIELLGSVSDAELQQLYAGAKALLYPVVDEDFGIVPIEAMAYGVPVIAHRSGGPCETVLDGRTGVFFEKLSATALAEAIAASEGISFDPQFIHQHAQKFSQAQFQNRLQKLLKKYVRPHQRLA